MCVDQADATAGETAAADEIQDFGVVGPWRGGQCQHKRHHAIAVVQPSATGDFPEHEGVDEHLVIVQEFNQPAIAASKVVDPDRSVDKNHRAGLRRRTGFARGSDPPSAASRRRYAGR